MNNGVKNPNSKTKIYKDYLKYYDLETLISEMTNSVMHSLDPNPIVYMIRYLSGLLTDEERVEFNINIEPPFPKGTPIVKFPKFKYKNILSKYLTKENWNDCKYIKTSFNNDINNLTYITEHSKDDKIGMVIVDKDCIKSYRKLIENIIYEVHDINKDKQYCDVLYKIGNSPKLQDDNFFFSDDIKSYIKYLKFCFSRNIFGFTYNNNDKRNKKLKSEIDSIILDMKEDGFLPEDLLQIKEIEKYIKNDPVILKEYQWMKEAGFVNRNYSFDERSIWANKDNTLIILVNFANHFEIISTINDCTGAKIKDNFNYIMDILKQAQVRFTFDVDKKYGYVTSNISLLGGGFKLIGLFEIKHLQKVENIIKTLNFSYFNINSNDTLLFEKEYHLSDQDVLSFVNKILVNGHGIKMLCENYNEVKINYYKIEDFKNKDCPIAKAYNDTFNFLKYEINLLGSNINEVIDYYYKTNENEDNFLFSSRFCYLIFYRFIHKYLLYKCNINLEITNYLERPEEPIDISNINPQNYISHIDNIHICIFRNLKDFPFPLNKNYHSYNTKALELIKNALQEINSHSKNKVGEFMELSKATEMIKKHGIKIFHNDDMLKYGIDSDYPNNRGFIKFMHPNLFATINDMNNINFILSINNLKENDNIKKDMVNYINIVNKFSRYIKFAFSEKLGFLTSCPKYLGNGIKISVDIKTKNISKGYMDRFVQNKYMSWSLVNNDENNGFKVYRIENTCSYTQSETELLCNWLYHINRICEQEES